MLLLTSTISIFNFKDEFIEFWTKAHGAPPSHRRFLLNAYGAANNFFMVEKCNDQHMPNAIRLVPNANSFRFFLLQFASLVIAGLFWVSMFIAYAFVAAYI